MKWFGNRWLWDQYPEFDQVPTQQLRRIFRRAYWRSFRRWQTWLAVIVLGPIPILAWNVWIAGWVRPFGHQILLSVIIPQGFQVIGILGFMHWNMKSTARYMREALPYLCINCGYDLRATPEKCPECGTVRNAASAADQPRG